MRISSTSRYGLEVLIELALAKDKLLSARVLSETIGVSIKYTEQIISVLVNGGFLNSFRGPSGGYTLAYSPNDMTVKEVLQVTEGDLSVEDSPSDIPNYNRSQQILRKHVWIPLKETLEDSLGHITIKELADKTKEKQIFDYSI